MKLKVFIELAGWLTSIAFFIQVGYSKDVRQLNSCCLGPAWAGDYFQFCINCVGLYHAVIQSATQEQNQSRLINFDGRRIPTYTLL